jgi:hypothetical protein
MDSTPQPLSSTSADLDSLVSVWEQACQTVEAVVTASVATCGVQVELSQIPEGEIPELDEILAKFNLSVSQAARALHSMALGRCVEALASCAETTEGCQAVVAADAIDVVQKCISCSWSDGKFSRLAKLTHFTHTRYAGHHQGAKILRHAVSRLLCNVAKVDSFHVSLVRCGAVHISGRILQSMSQAEIGGYSDVLLMQALEGIVRTDVARAEAASAGLISHTVARLHSEHPPIISSSCVILK